MPPTFDGENEKGEDVEAWLLRMRKYLQWKKYSHHMEVRVVIYNLQDNASILWE